MSQNSDSKDLEEAHKVEGGGGDVKRKAKKAGARKKERNTAVSSHTEETRAIRAELAAQYSDKTSCICGWGLDCLRFRIAFLKASRLTEERRGGRCVELNLQGSSKEDEIWRDAVLSSIQCPERVRAKLSLSRVPVARHHWSVAQLKRQQKRPRKEPVDEETIREVAHTVDEECSFVSRDGKRLFFMTPNMPRDVVESEAAAVLENPERKASTVASANHLVDASLNQLSVSDTLKEVQSELRACQIMLDEMEADPLDKSKICKLLKKMESQVSVASETVAENAVKVCPIADAEYVHERGKRKRASPEEESKVNGSKNRSIILRRLSGHAFRPLPGHAKPEDAINRSSPASITCAADVKGD